MKQLTTSKGTFGPFPSISIQSDHYLVGDLIFPFTVYGADGVIEDTTLPMPTPPVEVPQSVTMRQARLALLGAGVLPQVDAAIAQMPSPMKEAAQIEWEYAATVDRGSALIEQLAPALGLTEAEMDSLFVSAAGL